MPQAGPAFSNYPAVLGCPDLLLKKRKKNKTVAGITQDQQTTNATCCTCSLWGGDAKHPEVLNCFPSCCPGVSVNGNLSAYRTVMKGVPQGSIVGPLLYLIYVDDLAKKLEKTGCVSALYADDTACVVSNKDFKVTYRMAQLVLGLVDRWCKDNDMALSVSKTCGMPVDCPRNMYWRLGFPRTSGENFFRISREELAGMIRSNEFR